MMGGSIPRLTSTEQDFPLTYFGIGHRIPQPLLYFVVASTTLCRSKWYMLLFAAYCGSDQLDPNPAAGSGKGLAFHIDALSRRNSSQDPEEKNL